MAFGNNIAERSRKRNTLTLIRVNMVVRMSMEEMAKQTKGWARKTLAELEALRKTEFEAFPPK